MVETIAPIWLIGIIAAILLNVSLFLVARAKRYVLWYIALTPLINLFWFVNVFGLTPIDLLGAIFASFSLVLLATRSSAGTWRWGRHSGPLILYTMSFAFSIPAGTQERAFVGDGLGTFLKVLCGFASYHIFLNLFDRSDSQSFCRHVKFAIGITLLMVLGQLATGLGLGEGRTSYLQGPYHDPGNYTRVALLGIIFFLPEVGSLISRPGSLLSWAPIALSVVTLAYSVSRNVVAAAVFVVLAYATASRRFFAAALVVVVAVGFFLWSPTTQDLYARKLNKEINYLSGEVMSVERLGSGRIGQWSDVVEEFQEADLMHQAFGRGIGIGPHGQFVDLLKRNGVVGVLIALWFWLRLLWHTSREPRRNRGSIAYVPFLLVVAMLTLSFAAAPFGNFYYQIVLFGCLALLELQSEQNHGSELLARPHVKGGIANG